MAIGSKCEACGAPPPRITSGPFQGEPSSHSYCELCSADLCDSCMVHSVCPEAVEDGKHQAFIDDEEAV